MKTYDRSVTRSLLWESLEMAHVRMQLIVWAVGYVLCLAILFFEVRGTPQAIAITAIFTSVLFLVPLGYWLLRVWKIFRRMEAYVFCSTELNQPHHAPFRREMFSFMGVMETGEGRFAVETYPIFAGRGIIQPLMEDYVGRTVTLGWNRETENVVVIG